MTGGNARNLIVGGAIAVLMFATVPLAQVAGRHGGAARAGRSIAGGVGSLVTYFVETNTRMSVALSAATR